MNRRRGVAIVILAILVVAALAFWLGGGMNTLLVQAHGWQVDLQRGLAADVRAVRDGGWLAAGPLVLLSFLYGIVHAAGPGHGKAVIGAYVLADGRRLRRGMAIAWASALAQAVTATLLMTVAVLVLGMAGRQVMPAALWMERAGYGLIVLIGCLMLWRGWRGGRDHGHHHHGHHEHDHTGHEGHEHAHHEHEGHHHGPDCGADCGHLPLPTAQATESWRHAGLLVLSVGLRPCSGALLVLTFAAALGVYGAGVVATFAMALGTAITVSALAVLAVGSRRVATAVAAGDVRWLGRIESGLGLLAGVALMAMGGLFLAASFADQTPMPFR